jgi:hypothetical protein
VCVFVCVRALPGPPYAIVVINMQFYCCSRFLKLRVVALGNSGWRHAVLELEKS